MEVIPCFCCVFAAILIGAFLAFAPLLSQFFNKTPPSPNPPGTPSEPPK